MINLNILETRGENLTWPEDVFDRDKVILYIHLQYNNTLPPQCLTAEDSFFLSGFKMVCIRLFREKAAGSEFFFLLRVCIRTYPKDSHYTNQVKFRDSGNLDSCLELCVWDSQMNVITVFSCTWESSRKK